MSIFDKKTGDYKKPRDPLRQMQDSLLLSAGHSKGVSFNLGVPGALPANASTVLHPHLNLTSEHVVRDIERMTRGKGEKLESDYARGILRANGVDPDNMPKLSEVLRLRLHDEMVRTLHNTSKRRLPNRFGTLAESLLNAGPTDTVMTLGNNEVTVLEMREILLRMHHLTPEQYAALSPGKQNAIFDKINRYVDKNLRKFSSSRKDTTVLDRDALHRSLHEWASGPLILERPQGSSLHHLIDYDMQNTEGRFGKTVMEDWNTQIFVVENDWARALAHNDGLKHGHVPLPFEFCCWEFRISGVRVLAFTESSEKKGDTMWCVYGRDRHWVIDDYRYHVGDGLLMAESGQPEHKNVEFPRVARLVHDNIRASCIMIDANVAEHERVEISGKLAETRARSGRAPLKSHFVVRLLKRHARRAHVTRTASTTGERARQRGHFRMGHYVHYDDQDSGREQYVNAGGFIVSRTWKSWYFAGDPNNMITKEYRL